MYAKHTHAMCMCMIDWEFLVGIIVFKRFNQSDLIKSAEKCKYGFVMWMHVFMRMLKQTNIHEEEDKWKKKQC